MRRLLAIPVRAPRAALALMLALTFVSGWHARTIRVDGSFESLLPAQETERLYYEEVSKTFGNDEVAVVGVFADDVFAPGTLAKIGALSDRLADLDGVREVLSLTTVKSIRMADAGLEVSRLMPRVPETPEAVASLRARALATPLYLRNVVSADGRSAGITVVFEPMSGEAFQRRGLEQAIRRLVAEYQRPERVVVTGIPMAKALAARTMWRDVAIFTPLAVALVALVLGRAFGSVRGLTIPLVTALMGLTWTVGVMALREDPITIGTYALPPFVFAIAIASATQVVSRYDWEACLGRAATETVGRTMGHVGGAIVRGGLALVVGFLPFALSPIPAVSNFGVYSIVGVAAVLVAALTAPAAILVLLPVPTRTPETPNGQEWLSRLLERFGAAKIRHARVALALALAAAVAVAWGGRFPPTETDPVGFFSPEGAIRHAHALVEERLAGVEPVYVVVDGGQPESVTRLGTLTAMREIQDFIAAQPGVDTTLSLVDYLQEARHALQPDVEGRLPQTQSEVDQLLLLINPKDVRPVVTRDSSRATIVARTRLSGSSAVGNFVRAVEAFGEGRLPPGITVQATGAIVMLGHAADVLVSEQSRRIRQVMVVLLVTMSFLFWSPRIGLLVLFPAVVAIAALYGFVGWTGAALDIATSMVPAIVLGVAIVGAVHLGVAVKAVGQGDADRAPAFPEVVGPIGRATTIVTATLAAGFLAVGLSRFQPLRTFGVLTAMTMAVSLVAALLVTPALLAAARARGLR